MADLKKLESLGESIAEVDAAGGPTPEQIEAEKQQAEDEVEAQAWAQVPMMLGSVMSMIAPELKAVYTKEACDAWGVAMVPVAQKYGWNGPSNLPEIGLLITTASLAVPTVVIVRAKIRQMREAEAAYEAAKAAAMARTVVPSPVSDVGVSGVAAGGGDGIG